MAPEPSLAVSVVYTQAAHQSHEFNLMLPAGSTLKHALQACNLATICPEFDPQYASLGIWGRKASLDQVLRNQDRVEIYRPLRVDPKVARRERFVAQGSRGAGLFAKRRAGAKPGY